MRPRKTDLAHQALQTHRGALELRQRRALILCDGQRDLAELSSLLGADARALVDELAGLGYLQVDAAAGPIPATTSAPLAAPSAPARRRSLSAARIYLLDMLELQRNEVARLLRQRLQAAHEEATIAAALLGALAELPRFTAPGYAQRVRERVAEVLPEPYLPALQQLQQGG